MANHPLRFPGSGRPVAGGQPEVGHVAAGQGLGRVRAEFAEEAAEGSPMALLDEPRPLPTGHVVAVDRRMLRAMARVVGVRRDGLLQLRHVIRAVAAVRVVAGDVQDFRGGGDRLKGDAREHTSDGRRSMRGLGASARVNAKHLLTSLGFEFQ